MKYTKYAMGPYTLNIIKTDRFKTISFKLCFKRKVVKEEITIRNLINEILLLSNKSSPTPRLLARTTGKLYGIRYGASNSLSGNYTVNSFSTKFLHEKYTETGMNKKSLDFFLSLLLEPNVKRDKFDPETFSIAKKIIEDNINTSEDDLKFCSEVRMLETMNKNEVYAYRSDGYLTDLEKITAENLFEYYQSMLKSDHIDIFIIGDVNPNEIKEYFKKNFPVNTIKKPAESHFLEHKYYKKTIKKKIEKKDCMQSKLAIGLKIEKLTPFEKQYVIRIYNHIFGTSPSSLLFQEVREKNSLAYDISSYYVTVFNLIIITAGIDRKSFNKTIKIIKESLKKMEKGIFTEEDIAMAKKYYSNLYEQILDDPSGIINNYLNQIYLGFDELEVRKKELSKVTKEMVVSIAKKIHIDTIYLLEGSAVSEKN